SARPPNAAAGSPPPITFPNVIRSPATPSIPNQPDRDARNPVRTSSITSSAPCRSHSRFSSALKPDSGGTTPMLHGTASVMTQAMSLPCSWNAVSTAATSLYGRISVSAVVAPVTPGVSGSPNVATPEPAAASSEPTCPWEHPANFTTLARPVKPRARRIADIVASVPELTSRTFSAGVRATISSASSTSPGVGAPYDVPRPAASRTASTTAGCACPRIIGPQEHTRSTYSLPSASVRYGPRADAMKRGVPPTAPNARTGELTPPGTSAAARSNNCCERSKPVTRTSQPLPPATPRGPAPEPAVTEMRQSISCSSATCLDLARYGPIFHQVRHRRPVSLTVSRRLPLAPAALTGRTH